MGIQRQDSKSRRKALLGAMRLLTEDLSQCLLKARLARPHQYAMRQPSMPSLLVDHGITVVPHLVVVDRRHGLPPPCACLHTTRTKKAAGAGLCICLSKQSSVTAKYRRGALCSHCFPMQAKGSAFIVHAQGINMQHYIFLRLFNLTS